jgi:hypothetical protein
MTDTYARVMRSADEPGKRRATRSQAARRPDADGETEGSPIAAVDAAGAPAAKPKRSRSSAAKPKPPARTPRKASPAGAAPGAVPASAAPRTSAAAQLVSATGPQADAAKPVASAAVPTARNPVQAQAAHAAGSPAEAVFADASAAFMAGRDAQASRELQFEDVPAPKRLAPFATAIAATIQRDDADVAWGRLVLLYDPDGQQGWDGFFRLVAYVRAEVEPEIAADPLLGEVGWSWLSEALDAHVPGYAVPSGTVTRVITEGFGGKADELPLTGFELRASWSPAGPEGPRGSSRPTGAGQRQSDLGLLDLSAHIAAWCDCLSAAAGLEPPGTRALRQPGRG